MDLESGREALLRRASNQASGLPKRYRGDLMESAYKNLPEGIPVPGGEAAEATLSPNDVLNAQRLGLDVARFQTDQQKAAAEAARADREYGLEERKATGEEQKRASELQQSFLESNQTAPGWMKFSALNRAGGDPVKAQSILAALEESMLSQGVDDVPADKRQEFLAAALAGLK
jgi:hypothetical protein